jgi:acetyl esterase/lipase
VSSLPAAEHRNLVYASRVGYRPLELDLYLPPPAVLGPHPVIGYLHGGGWQRGSKRELLPVLAHWDPSPFQRMVDAGFAVAAIDYRLSGEATFPAPLEDVRSALQWLAMHSAAWGIDEGRLFLWGESAGAHLAALAALDTADRATAPVRGVVAWFAPSDLMALDEDAARVGGELHSPADSRESRLLGGPLFERREQAMAASPVTYAHAGAPPFLLMHGDADVAVPYQQSLRLAEALKATGSVAEVELVPGAGHMWTGASDVEAIFTRSLAFVADLAAEALGRGRPTRAGSGLSHQ